MRSLIGAVTLAACVMVGAPAYADTIITITASGGLSAGSSDPTQHFGLTTDLSGVSAVFTWVIDVGQLGVPTSGTGFNLWNYDDALMLPLDFGVASSAIPIGITGSVTINAVTLTGGTERQLLEIAQDYNGDFVGEREDAVLLRTDRSLDGSLGHRDYVDLTLDTYSNPLGIYSNSFVPGLDPTDLVGLTLPTSCGPGGTYTDGEGNVISYSDALDASFNHLEGHNLNGSPIFGFGDINMCGGDVSFSVTERNVVPEPMTILIFGAGLLGLGALRRRKARKTA